MHVCALFVVTQDEPEMLLFVEDVGRHYAMNTIAGRIWMNSPQSVATVNPDRLHQIFYITGCLTSEMVIKSAQIGTPVVVSCSGITQIGHQVA